MENLAIHICYKVFGVRRPQQGKYCSIDLIFERDGKNLYFGIKSGPNWGNSDQVI